MYNQVYLIYFIIENDTYHLFVFFLIFASK